MKVEVAVVRWEEVDLVEAMEFHRIAWLECASLLPVLEGLHGSDIKRAVVQYVKDNIERVIDTNKTGGYW